MKKFLALATLMVLMTSTSAFAAVSGGPHDFNSWAGGELCVPCHTPHNADPYATGSTTPLWNHTDPTGAAFVMYSSVTLDGTIAASPQSRSAACLSCHDGVTTVDNYGGSVAGTLVLGGSLAAVNADAILGKDLSNDHPISVTYDDVADTGLNAIAGITLPMYGVGTDQVECATCHAVHSDGLGDTLNGVGMLRVDNALSALCTQCHAK